MSGAYYFAITVPIAAHGTKGPGYRGYLLVADRSPSRDQLVEMGAEIHTETQHYEVDRVGHELSRVLELSYTWLKKERKTTPFPDRPPPLWGSDLD